MKSDAGRCFEEGIDSDAGGDERLGDISCIGKTVGEERLQANVFSAK